MRNAPDLSITTAPLAAACGAHCFDTSSGTSNIARSTPSNASADISATRTCSPRTGSILPADLAEATSLISPHTSGLVETTSRITVPTAPVAPTIARTGRPVPPAALIALFPRTRRPRSTRCPARTHGAWRSPPNRGQRRRDHPDVDARVGERAEEVGADAWMRAHASADQRDLPDPVVEDQRIEADLVLNRVQRGHRGLAVLSRQGERDVGPAG